MTIEEILGMIALEIASLSERKELAESQGQELRALVLTARSNALEKLKLDILERISEVA